MVDQDAWAHITVTGYDFTTQTFVCESDEAAPEPVAPEQAPLRPACSGTPVPPSRRVK